MRFGYASVIVTGVLGRYGDSGPIKRSLFVK